MTKIWTHITWSPKGKCIGSGYNEALTQHDDNDWLAVIDHDAMFTTGNWYQQMQQVIQEHPKCKGLTGRVNRMATQEQMVLGIDPNNMDYAYHRRVGDYLSKKYYGQSNCITTPGHFSGTFFAVHIGTMRKLGGFEETGHQLACDNALQAALVHAGHEFRVCNGIYIFHWYRFDDPYPHSKQVMDQIERLHYNQLQLGAQNA